MLISEKKEHFIKNVERYKKTVPSCNLRAMLQGWIDHYGGYYLEMQTLFKPFSEQHVELYLDMQCEWAGEELFQGRGG